MPAFVNAERNTAMKLSKEFYCNPDVVQLAQELLGKYLFTCIDGILTGGIITETEAYRGIDDKASHAYNGRRTARTEIMYREGGTAYVYLCYGMHALFNVVSNQKDIPHAILIRAVKPTHGLDVMLKRSKKAKIDRNFGVGPGKVSKILGISVPHSGLSLLDNQIWIEDRGLQIASHKITATPRIGIDYAGEDAKLLYRFLIPQADLPSIETSTI